MTDAGAPEQRGEEQSRGTLVCEGSACAVVGAAPGAAVGQAVPGEVAGLLDGLLRKQISDQVDRAGASAPHAG